MHRASQRIVRRFLLAKVLPPKGKVALNLDVDLPTLWFENEAGDVWIPWFGHATPREPNDDEKVPPGFNYQFSRFPRELTETVLQIITQEDIDACDHEETVIDHGLIEGLEGRICRSCGGRQIKKDAEPWPAVWTGAGSSRSVATGRSTYPVDLVLAMTRPTPEEIKVALQRGYTILPTSFERAVILAATSCERCLNVLCWRHGLNDGYEEGSPEWAKAREHRARSGPTCGSHRSSGRARPASGRGTAPARRGPTGCPSPSP